MIKCPWDEYGQDLLINLPDYNWVQKYVLDKGIPKEYLSEPEGVKKKQAIKLCQTLLSNRQFVLLACDDSAYIKGLYFYLAGIWCMTANRGFKILNPTYLDPFADDYRVTLRKAENTSLLIIPYTDPTDYNLRKTKNALGGILSQRKAAMKPTVTDVFCKKSLDQNVLKDLEPVFGQQSIPLFTDENSNAKIIKIRRQ